MIGVFVRVEANAADGGGQQAHFLGAVERWVREPAARSRLARVLGAVIGERSLDGHGRANPRAGVSRASESSREAAGYEPRGSATSLSPGDGDCSDVPPAASCLLSRTRFRSDVGVSGPGGRRGLVCRPTRSSPVSAVIAHHTTERCTRFGNSRSFSDVVAPADWHRCHCPATLTARTASASVRARPAPPFCRETQPYNDQ